MKKNFIVLCIALLGLYLSSCKTSKDMVYLNDIQDQEFQAGVPQPFAEYKVKVNDNLYIDVQSLSPEINALFNPAKNTNSTTGGTSQNYGQLSGQYLNGFQVDLGGNVALPVIGKVHVAGLTVNEAQAAIQAKADEYIKDGSVKVKLLSFKITVMGEVKKPGVYYNYNNYMTILEGISMAGGETDYSRIQKVLVVRPTEKGTKTYRLDLSKKKFLTSEAFYLQPNDVVYVEPDKYKNVKLNSPMYTLFLSTISTIVLIINVI
ncbi:polysaccharide export protein [Puteibacter caeruleilacunae]|nr:polysaccharide export protein [Puteibacter caeruleilacunae]